MEGQRKINLRLFEGGDAGEGTGEARPAMAKGGHMAGDAGGKPGPAVRIVSPPSAQGPDAGEKRAGEKHSLGGEEALRRALDEQAPVMDFLKKRYGEESAEGLPNALKAGGSAQEANEAAQERERAAREAQARQAARAASAIYADWQRQAAQMEADYPGFDLKAELKNRPFRALLKSGLSMDAAYKAVHIDAFLSGAVAWSARQARAAAAEDIMARGARPAENGMGAVNAVSSAPDYSRMTAEEMRALLAKVMRGEPV